MYIQSGTLNGELLTRPWFYHRQLIEGGTLILALGPEPNRQWGARPEDAPPSMSPSDGQDALAHAGNPHGTPITARSH